MSGENNCKNDVFGRVRLNNIRFRSGAGGEGSVLPLSSVRDCPESRWTTARARQFISRTPPLSAYSVPSDNSCLGCNARGGEGDVALAGGN